MVHDYYISISIPSHNKIVVVLGEIMVMLTPHIAECTRLNSTTNDLPNHSWANVPVHTSRSHGSLVIRVRGGEDAARDV
jgi:hypothetical protein